MPSLPRGCARAACAGLALAALAAAGPATAAPEDAYAAAHARWARVLESVVDAEGAVDYRRLARHRADLDAFVARIARDGPRTRPEAFPTPASRLAFHIDAYNAISMRAVLDAGVPRTLGGLYKYWFFLARRHPVDGESLSLYAYENERIRTFGDPRVHFALNCMSVGCPRLPRTAFEAATLDRRLDEEARRFLAEPRNVAVDHERRVVRLSGIFGLYPEDFPAAGPALLAYVNRYREDPVPEDYAVETTDFDWTVKASAR